MDGSYEEDLKKHSHRTEEQAEKSSSPTDNEITKTEPIFREYGPATLGGGKAILAAKRYQTLKRDDAGNGNKAHEGIHANKETKTFPRPLSSHPPVASVESASGSEPELQHSRDAVASPSSTTTTCGSNCSTRSGFTVPKAKTWPCTRGQDGVSAVPFAGRPHALCTVQGTGDSASQAAGGTLCEEEKRGGGPVASGSPGNPLRDAQADEGKIEDDEGEKRGRSVSAKPCTSSTTTRGSSSTSTSTPPPICKAPEVKLSLRGGGPGLQRSTQRPNRKIRDRAAKRAEENKPTARAGTAFSNDPHPDHYRAEEERAHASSSGHKSPSSLAAKARSPLSSRSPSTEARSKGAWERAAERVSSNPRTEEQSPEARLGLARGSGNAGPSDLSVHSQGKLKEATGEWLTPASAEGKKVERKKKGWLGR